MIRTQHPALTALLTRLEAVASVDNTALDTWAIPLAEELAERFYLSRRPMHDFRIWLREQYLAELARREGVL